MSIDGKSITDFKVDGIPESGTVSLRLPVTFFGEVNDETLMEDKTVTLSNPDGKTVHNTFHFLLSSQMSISGMQAEFPTYSLGGLNGSGGIVKIFVSGRALKSDAIVHLDEINLHTQATVITFSAGSLQVGNLQVSIYRGTALYGACSFQVTQ